MPVKSRTGSGVRSASRRHQISNVKNAMLLGCFFQPVLVSRSPFFWVCRQS
jgi:hypothetical protein